MVCSFWSETHNFKLCLNVKFAGYLKKFAKSTPHIARINIFICTVIVNKHGRLCGQVR